MKRIILIAISIVLLISILAVMFIQHNKRLEEVERQQVLSDALYSSELEKIKAEREKAEKERQEYLEKLKNYTVYQRLAERTISLNVLYLGDEVTYGLGTDKPQAESWRILLKGLYKRYWSQNVIGTEISSYRATNGSDALDFAYVALREFSKLYPLHMTYVCIGSSKELYNFAYRYERIVRLAKKNNALSDVVCIIQHGQSNEDAESIMAIAEYYGTVCVDMRPYFEGRENELLTQDGYPNVKGNEVYADVIIEEIKKAVDEDKQLFECPEEFLFESEPQINIPTQDTEITE